jgi:hypothetical protein
MQERWKRSSFDDKSMVTSAGIACSIADLDIIQDGYTNAIRMCRTKADLPNLLKMRGGLLYITKA